MEIEIRYTQPRDVNTLLDFFEAYEAEPSDPDNGFYFGWEIESIQKDAVEYYQKSWLGAFDEEKIIGICWIGESEGELGRNGKPVLVQSDVYVLPNRRGKGVGTELVKQAIALAKKEYGDRDVHITLLKDDLVPFYERMNFVFEDKGLGFLYC